MELLPCPFCGLDKKNPPIVLNNKKQKHMPIHTTVQCTNCGCEPNHYMDNEDDSIKIWNTRHSPWISVKDRLPENDIAVLGFLKQNHPFYTDKIIDRFQRVIYLICINNSCSIIPYMDNCTLTHWQPLPEPPKETIK